MKKMFLLLAAMLTPSSLALGADTYTIDGAHSSANFAVKHLGISTVRGRFTDVSGTILFDRGGTGEEFGDGRDPVRLGDHRQRDRDKHLNSADFFDTAKYPEIRFQSTSVRKTGEDQYVAVGNLTIRDVSKQVELPFTLAQGKGTKGEPRLGAEGALTINRFDYHVSYDPTGLGVGKEVKIDVSVEASK